MKITVVTPTHPGPRAHLLIRALESVAFQTLPAAAISVAVDVDRQGAAPTRQRALEAVQTPWVAFLDSDDLFLPRHLELLSKHAIETGADFVYSWFKILDAGGQVLEDDPIFPVTHYLNPWDPDDPIETTITTLVRTDLAKQVGFQALNRGEMNSGEDRFFTLGCRDAGAKISHLVRKTWLWRHHGQNTSGLPTKGDAAPGTNLLR
jgi:glycosyltransferase involved in cell wall biosynthesis